MSGTSYAILIGNSQFPNEPLLPTLRCPINDVHSMQEVLASEKHGPYDVQVLENWDHYAIQLAILRTLKRATYEDKVLIYYAGHGKINNDDSALYLAAANTNVEYLSASSVSVAEITKQMKYSASKQLILVLDCCYSGAIDKFMSPETLYRGDAAEQVGMNFRNALGSGTYVLTACSSLQRAAELEGDSNGLLTKHLVQGIREGKADRDDDGLISMYELTSYVQEQVKREGDQTPSYFSFREEDGGLVIAKSGKPARSRKLFEVQDAIYEAALARRASFRTTRAALALLLPDPSAAPAIRSISNDFVDRLHSHLADPRAMMEILEEAHGLAHDLLVLPPSIRQELEQQRDLARAEAEDLRAALDTQKAVTQQAEQALEAAQQRAARLTREQELHLGETKKSAQQHEKLRDDIKKLQKELNEARKEAKKSREDIFREQAMKENFALMTQKIDDLQQQHKQDQQSIYDTQVKAAQARASAITEADAANEKLALLSQQVGDLQQQHIQDQETLRKANEATAQALEANKKKVTPIKEPKAPSKKVDATRHPVDPALLPALKAIKGTVQALVDRETAVLTILKRYGSEPDFFIASRIPTAKLAAARSRFVISIDEKILGLVDCTVFGSAKDAVLFGHRHMYWYNIGTRGTIAYTDLATAKLEKAIMGITINGDKVSINGSGFNTDRFLAMVKELKTSITA